MCVCVHPLCQTSSGPGLSGSVRHFNWGPVVSLQSLCSLHYDSVMTLKCFGSFLEIE